MGPSGPTEPSLGRRDRSVIRNVVVMDPTPCYVLDGENRWPGRVLAWVRDADGWHGVVRYARTSPEGWTLGYEHAVPAASLTPR
jgi:hypothetical protein